MSIFLKNVIWSQTEYELFVNVSIIGKKSIDDIIIADTFLKINSKPFFYELFFEHSINAEKSSCKLLESNIKFNLKKEKCDWWSNIGKTAKSNANSNDTITNETKREILCEYEMSVQAKYAFEKKCQSSLKRCEIDKEIERENQIRQRIFETESFLENLQISKVQ